MTATIQIPLFSTRGIVLRSFLPSRIASPLRQHAPEYLQRFGERVPLGHRKVLAAITRCRTGHLGGVRYQCGGCGLKYWVGRSCGNRRCAGHRPVLFVVQNVARRCASSKSPTSRGAPGDRTQSARHRDPGPHKRHDPTACRTKNVPRRHITESPRSPARQTPTTHADASSSGTERFPRTS